MRRMVLGSLISCLLVGQACAGDFLTLVAKGAAGGAIASLAIYAVTHKRFQKSPDKEAPSVAVSWLTVGSAAVTGLSGAACLLMKHGIVRGKNSEAVGYCFAATAASLGVAGSSLAVLIGSYALRKALGLTH